MKICIPNPCAEYWRDMSLKEKGRYCDVCEKTVVDFTKHNTNQIKDFIHQHTGRKICGRFHNSQLSDKLSTQVSITLKMLGITSVLFLWATPVYAQDKDSVLSEDEIITYEPDSTYMFIMGEYALEDDHKKDGDYFMFNNVDLQPEFQCGADSLKSYLVKEINHLFLKDRKHNGKVYVEFMVEISGEITEPKIVRGLSEEVNNEVLRVVSHFPVWHPGIKDGKPVRVKCVLPIVF